MENASKALIMAGSVLLGVMLLSIATVLFFTFSDYSAGVYKQMEDTRINEFNTQFLKFYGSEINEVGKTIPILCTAHDIVSLVNLAKDNNKFYELADLTKYDPNTYYIQIDVGTNRNLEKASNDWLIDFIKRNDIVKNGDNIEKKNYYIKDEPIISNITKRVCYIKFVEYKT